ncbi:hypothetical protein ORS3428_26390 [Mesorhizobium sp. ORS 3428]|nr:hypothetical protein ORS3428_26390 [Mesorhizobium sp. ORS 3428]
MGTRAGKAVAPAPEGLTKWLRPSLVGRVKFLKSEQNLAMHAEGSLGEMMTLSGPLLHQIGIKLYRATWVSWRLGSWLQRLAAGE